MEEATFVLQNAIKNGLEEGSWQEFEYISAYLTSTIPWSVLPYQEKNKLNIPLIDTGIDSISKDYKTAVQAKCRTNISLEAIDHFYLRTMKYFGEETNKIVTTPENIKMPLYTDCLENIHQREITNEEIKNVRKELKDNELIEYEVETKHSLRVREVHQNKIVNHYLKSDKKLYTIKAPCGFGKTFIIKKIIDKMDDEKQYIIFVPSIALAYQYKNNFDGIEIVCSENNNPKFDSKLIVCVYNSIEKVKHLNFEIVFIDEAHHIKTPDLYAGIVENNTLEVTNKDKTYLDELKEFTLNNRSVLLSATIDDPDYEFKEEDAIKNGIILDYQIVSMVFEKEPTLLKIANNIKENILTYNAIIAYSNTVTKAKQFHEDCEKIGLKSCLITAETPTKERNLYFQKFMSGEINIISSVNTIAEGIDLPRCNTALFLDKKGSKIMLKQCTGRVSRNYIGKTQGYVILITSKEDEYKNVVSFISTIENNKIITRNNHKFICVNGDDNMKMFDVYDKDIEHLYNRVWDKKLDKWIFMFNLLQEFYKEFKRLPTAKERYKEVGIGSWQDHQRQEKKNKKLSKEREKKLSSLDYWIWDGISHVSNWKDSFELLKNYIEENGKYPPPNKKINGNNLNSWIKNQRKTYHENKKGITRRKITEEQIILLETLPDWRWSDKPPTWEESCEKLRNFINENNRLPTKGDSSVLSGWIQHQRKNKTTKLTEEQINTLNNLPHWKWDEKPPKWDESYDLVKEFMDNNGRTISRKDDIKLYNWIQNTKKREREGKLTDIQKNKISELIYWNENNKSK